MSTPADNRLDDVHVNPIQELTDLDYDCHDPLTHWSVKKDLVDQVTKRIEELQEAVFYVHENCVDLLDDLKPEIVVTTDCQHFKHIQEEVPDVEHDFNQRVHYYTHNLNAFGQCRESQRGTILQVFGVGKNGCSGIDIWNTRPCHGGVVELLHSASDKLQTVHCLLSTLMADKRTIFVCIVQSKDSLPQTPCILHPEPTCKRNPCFHPDHTRSRAVPADRL